MNGAKAERAPMWGLLSYPLRTGFLFIFVMVLYYIRLAPALDEANAYLNTFFVLDYSHGLLIRALVGQILTLFTQSPSLWMVNCIAAVSTWAMIGAVAGVIVWAAGRVSAQRQLAFSVLVLLFGVNPNGLSHLFLLYNFGRHDIYSIILFIVSLVVIHKVRRPWPVLFLSVAALFIHENYLFFFLPVVLVFWAYTLAHRQEVCAADFLGLCLTAACSLAVFVILYLFGRVQDYESLYHAYNDKSSFMVHYKLFEIFSLNGAVVFPSASTIRNGLINIVYMLPIWALLAKLWREALRKQTDTQQRNTALQAWCARCFPLTLLAALPAFILTVDWGRWFSLILICQWITLWMLIRTGDPGADRALDWLNAFVRKNPLWIAALMLCLLVLPYIETVDVFTFIIP